MPRPRILLVDSHDSFAYNVVDALRCLHAHVDVVQVNACEPAICNGGYDGVILGPGPGTAVGNGPLMLAVAQCSSAGVPILGICLGLQAIAAYYGGRIVRCPRPVHGEVATVHHRGARLFSGIPSPFRATRYHSLCVAREALPAPLQVTATSHDGVIQAIEDPFARTFGVQFHPESFLSENGPLLFRNFLESTGHRTC